MPFERYDAEEDVFVEGFVHDGRTVFTYIGPHPPRTLARDLERLGAAVADLRAEILRPFEQLTPRAWSLIYGTALFAIVVGFMLLTIFVLSLYLRSYPS